MATDLAALKDRFSTAVDYFNRDNFTVRDFDKYGLDRTVKMKRLDDPGYYDESKGEVTNYFVHGNGNKDKARFTPGASPDFQLIGGFGFVSGTADFVDKTVPTPSPARRIAYSFTYSSASGEWKAIHLWGKYI